MPTLSSLGRDCLMRRIAQSARNSVPDGQALRYMNTVRSFVAGQQGLATLYDAPLVPLFLTAIFT